MSKVKQDGNNVNPFLVSIKAPVSNQMASIYMLRLAELRPHVLMSAARAMARLPDKITYCERIIKLKRGTGLCLIVGILFKEMKKRPKLLSQYHKKAGKAIAAPLPPAGSCIITNASLLTKGTLDTKDGTLPEYYSPTDLVFLEDETGRVGLTGSIETTGFVSGIALAIIGESVTGETFKVVHICHVGCAPSPTTPMPMSMPIYSTTGTKNQAIVFLSGLRIQNTSLETTAFLSRVGKTIQFLSERYTLARVIIAGDSLNITTLSIVPLSIKPVQHVEPSRIQSLYSQDKPDESEQDDVNMFISAESKQKTPLQVFDAWLANLAQVVTIDLLPGYMDPTNHALPQQPFDSCLISRALATKRVHTLTNPCMLQLNGCSLYGNSGQPITDLVTFCDSKRVTSTTSATDAHSLSDAISKTDESKDPTIAYMEATLLWRHMAPTMPDSLACLHVGGNEDNFIFRTTPHVYFAGNQPRFASSTVKSTCIDSNTSNGTREIRPVSCHLISIPVVQQSNALVVFNLVDQSCISFDLLK